MKTPIEVKVKEVPNNKRVETVEKYLKQLEFPHQLRLASEVMIRKSLKSHSDTKAILKINLDGAICEFTITVELTNVETTKNGE